jgi:hypothetical protein
MRLNEPLFARLVEHLNCRGLGYYLLVALATPWANMEEALAQSIRAFLNI